MRQHDTSDHDPVTVTHEIDLDASLDKVWAALTDPAQLGEWLGGDVDLTVQPAAAGHVIGDDGTRYAVLVTDVDEHQRVAWHWWDDRGTLSSVELTVQPVGESTRLRVVETLVAPDRPGVQARACARHWESATSRLWERVSVCSMAW
jgi:uncharacterized protein YndB with AHSA1/START domain